MGDPSGRDSGRSADGDGAGRRTGRGIDMAFPPEAPGAFPGGEDVLFLPPVPLATGRLLEPEDDGDPVPITSVEVVVSTADGEQLRIPLQHRHGAWWAP